MTITLAAVGDICPGDHYFSLGHGTGSRLARGDDPFEEIAPLLGEADLVLGNLEGPLSASSSQDPGPEATVFRGPPSAAALLKSAGLDLVHVANNHVLQHGAEAFRSTIASLEQQGLTPLGLLDGLEARPVVRSVAGLKLGFLGYSLVPERYQPGHRLYAAPSLQAVIQDVEMLRGRVDVVVVSVHWGREATARPTRAVVEAGEAMIAVGAALVLGHHPHWFQPVRQVGRGLVAYSLGDFVFDLFWDRRSIQSAILRVDLDAGGVVGHRLIPVQLNRDYRVRLQPDAEARRFLAGLEAPGRPPADAGRLEGAEPAQRMDVARKLAYFLAHFHQGSSAQKARFALSKLAGAVRGKG